MLSYVPACKAKIKRFFQVLKEIPFFLSRLSRQACRGPMTLCTGLCAYRVAADRPADGLRRQAPPILFFDKAGYIA
jgi:hypothetical protein